MLRLAACCRLLRGLPMLPWAHQLRQPQPAAGLFAARPCAAGWGHRSRHKRADTRGCMRQGQGTVTSTLRAPCGWRRCPTVHRNYSGQPATACMQLLQEKTAPGMALAKHAVPLCPATACAHITSSYLGCVHVREPSAAGRVQGCMLLACWLRWAAVRAAAGLLAAAGASFAAVGP